MDTWSPFAPLAEVARPLPAAPVLPDLAGAPAPRVGLLWTAGTPAGLADELEDGRGELAVGLAARQGSYRRPLDQDGISVRRLTALRWQPVGERSGVVGRVIGDHVLADLGSFSPQGLPYSADPFVIADTTVSGMRLIRTRLEGGAGWRYGNWGLGLALGLDVGDHRTRESALPRLVRWSTPAVAFGLSRALGWSGIALSAYGRWVGGDETVRFIAWPALGVVYPLHGYSEPTPVLIGGSPDRLEYTRFIERDAFGAGTAVRGRALGASWAAFVERSRRRDSHFRVRRKDAPADVWRAEGWRGGAALTGVFARERLLVFAVGEYAVLKGDGFRADLEQAILHSRESVLDLAVELRYAPARSDLRAAVRAVARREDRSRDDFLAEIGSDIESWTTGAAFELALPYRSGTIVSIGVGVAVYVPVATIPDPEFMGDAYRRFLAPELAVYAMRTQSRVVAAAVRRQTGEHTALLLRGEARRIVPSKDPSAVPLAPEGDRQGWNIALGFLWGP